MSELFRYNAHTARGNLGEEKSRGVGDFEKIAEIQVLSRRSRYRPFGWQGFLTLSRFDVAIPPTSGMGSSGIKRRVTMTAGLLSLSRRTRQRLSLVTGMAAVAVFILTVNFNDLITRSGLPTTTDLFMGFVLIGVLLEATRRVSNPILPGIAVFSLLYCFFGRYFPDMFAHRGFDIPRIINHMYLGTEGIFGVPLGVSSTFVFMFILFGTFLEQTGMGKFIIDLAMAIAGWSTGGPAKVAVVSSGLMGTISGSSVAT